VPQPRTTPDRAADTSADDHGDIVVNNGAARKTAGVVLMADGLTRLPLFPSAATCPHNITLLPLHSPAC
jgi:hypothetical protein